MCRQKRAPSPWRLALPTSAAIFFSVTCLGGPRVAMAAPGLAAALAVPYFSGVGQETFVTLVNGSELSWVLRVIAIDGNLSSQFDKGSFACPLLRRASARLRIRRQGAGRSLISAECSSLSAPGGGGTSVVAIVPGERGVIFVAIEDPMTGATVSVDAIFGEATLFDFARGTQASIDAIDLRDAGANDGDRTYRFDGLEYRQLPSRYFGDFEASDADVETHLVMFNPDGTTGAGAPESRIDITFKNTEAFEISALHTFSGFDRVALTSIDSRFSKADLGSDTGVIEISGALTTRTDSHDEESSIGNGDGIRRTPFFVWLIREERISSSDAGALLNSAAGRLLLQSATRVVPSPGDAYPVLRVIDDPDLDGIESVIDTEPTSFSNDFDDTPRGGSTTGRILKRGDQNLRVSEILAASGVRIESRDTGGPEEALLEVCGGAAQLMISPGSVALLTCTSVLLSVEAGLFELLFDLGEPASVELGPGNTLRFDPDAGRLEADPDNIDSLLVETAAGGVVLAPGETVLLGQIAIRPRVIHGSGFGPPVRVVVFGSAEVDVREVIPGSLAFGPAGARPVRVKWRDVNRDGFEDLTAKFRMRKIGLTPGDTQACLFGELAPEGEASFFLSCAAVRVIGPNCAIGPELVLLLPMFAWLRRPRPALTPRELSAPGG